MPYIWRAGPASRDLGTDRYVQTTFAFRGLGQRPLSPVFVRGRRSSGDLSISWIRRTRTGGDSWNAGEVPLSEASEAYEVEILNGAAVIRTVAVATPAAIYTAAQQTIDFGAPQPLVSVRVYQVSATWGTGNGTRGNNLISALKELAMVDRPWMDFAWAELGQREVAGPGDNVRIVDFYRDAGHPETSHDDVPWCAAFVGACLRRARLDGTGSLLARSYLDWGEPTDARLGAIAVFSRGDDPSSGHVGFYLDGDEARVFVLGGNQADSVSVTVLGRDRLLGLRWPGSPINVGRAANKNGPLSLFDAALAHVLEMEGGWTEDAHDPGGPTNFGITLATLAAYRGIAVDASSFPVLREALKTITPGEVQKIYAERYWKPSHAADLPPPLALMHFDASVNHGLGASARMLQEAAGVSVDGEIGPQTLAASTHLPIAPLLRRYADLRRARYRALPTFWRFGRGWLARVDATLRAAATIFDVAINRRNDHDRQHSGFPANTAVKVVG